MFKCSVSGCERKSHAKELCKSHYSQVSRGKAPTPLRPYSYQKDVCSFEGCDLPQKGNNNYCGGHNAQFIRNQKMKPLYNHMSLKERVESKIHIDKNGCMIWNGQTDTSGYPQMKFAGKNYLVHRAYYKVMVGDIESHDSLDHLCRNKLCVNPEHLEPVSISENVKRMLTAKYYETEINRLVDFIESLGYDSNTLTKKEE